MKIARTIIALVLIACALGVGGAAVSAGYAEDHHETACVSNCLTLSQHHAVGLIPTQLSIPSVFWAAASIALALTLIFPLQRAFFSYYFRPPDLIKLYLRYRD